jgi:hypothetical protein
MIIEGQLPRSLPEKISDIDKNQHGLFRMETTELNLLFLRMHDLDNNVWIVPLRPSQDSLIYEGPYSTANFGGTAKVQFKQQQVKADFSKPLQGILEIQHHQGNFSGNIELCFLVSGIDSSSRKQWLIPTFNYNGNHYGKGEYPHPDITKPLGVRADRLAQPYILYQDNRCSCAIGLYSDGPTEGGVPGFPASLNWQMNSEEQVIALRLFYPYWEYGHGASETEAVYYKKNEFKAAERGILEWSKPTSLKLPFHIWFGEARDNHTYATVSWYVWQTAESKRLEQHRPLAEELSDRIRFLNKAYYDPHLGPGHYRCNMAYDYAAIGFIWRSLEAAFLDWWLEAWGNTTMNGSELASDYNRGYRAVKNWAEYGVINDIIMPSYQGDGYCIRQEYGQQALSTRVLAEGINTFIHCYTLSEALGKPEPLFRRVAEKQLEWLIRCRLENGTFARYYLSDGTPFNRAVVATGTVISVLAEASRLFSRPDFAQAAREAYQVYREQIILKEAFYGGTLDADTEDKEAGYFGLEAAIALYRITGDDQYLQDAKRAADYILTYTWAYRMRTFPQGSMATVNQVDTWGATSVSPENQHFDPYNNAALILTGLFAGEPAYCELGLAMLYFALDGRWSISQGANCGRKQPEQLLNTNWFYNVESVVRRGDYRDINEEWAWPQVVPCLEYLGVGGACLDLRTGRGIGIDGCKVTSLEFSNAKMVVLLEEIMGCSHSVLLRIFNYPNRLFITANPGNSRKLLPNQLEQGIRFDLTEYQKLQLTITG